jgi:hypothetical protein
MNRNNQPKPKPKPLPKGVVSAADIVAQIEREMMEGGKK